VKGRREALAVGLVWLAWLGAVLLTVALGLATGTYTLAAGWSIHHGLWPLFAWDYNWYHFVAYGGYPDLDELFKQQDAETDPGKREAILHKLQRMMHERVVVAPLFLYIWPSGIGPRVEEPGLMLINPYPWSAPYEDVRLKRP